MAYITKAEVQAKSVKLKELNKKFGVKARFSGSNSSTLTLTIDSSGIDFISNYNDCSKHKPNFDQARANNLQISQIMRVNTYYLSGSFCGIALEYLSEAFMIMRTGHYDNSDSITDYFDTAWYNDIQIGRFGKGYKLV